MNTDNKGQEQSKITALYCRLSVDDMTGDRKGGKADESNSITNQKRILSDYCKKMGFLNTRFFVDDGISGTTFNRPGFQEMEALVEAGPVERIIVKDLSRFGREQVEMGRLTQVVYPTLGVDFISLQENVNTSTGDGLEMMPFYNIFNEWYAAQTSKKIRQVWKTKSEHGERVSSTVAFGYKRDPDNKTRWLIDEPAAQVVKRIFALCLAGKGPLQIAKQLERERILTPGAYYDSIGRKHSTKTNPDPYRWSSSTVENILANRQYTGCTVNFLTTTVSYKVHKTIYNTGDDIQIIPNTQEAIIDENTWLRVQELREHRIRPTATGRTSLFSGKVYCYNCKSHLHFCAAKSLKRNQEFFRCSRYKDGRGDCTIHFIRDVVLEKAVLEAVGALADFVKCYEGAFLYLAAKKSIGGRKETQRNLKQAIETGQRRIKELDYLIEKIYEDATLGRLEQDRFQTMFVSYEQQQKELKTQITESERQLRELEKVRVDMRMLLGGLRDFLEMKELNQEIVNKLIQRIEIHNNDKSSGHCHVEIDIYFTAVGMFELPDAEVLAEVLEEARQNPIDLKSIVA